MKGAAMVSEFEVIFYDKADGTEPAKDFLKSLDIKMLAKMARIIVILQKNGATLREPYSKSLGDGIFELRAQVGSDISRVLYFFSVEHRAVLTNGFIKKTQKTKQADVDQAKSYRSEYLNRKENDHNNEQF